MKIIRRVLAAVAALSLAAGVALAEKAPDFTLKSTDGKTVTLSQLKGKVVFVDFWASWCPPCRRSIPAVEAMYEQYAQNPHVAILGVNVENEPAATAAFVKKNAMKYTVLNDDGSAARAYRVSGIPAFFVISPAGEIAQKFVGFTESMKTEWANAINAQLKTLPAPAKMKQ